MSIHGWSMDGTVTVVSMDTWSSIHNVSGQILIVLPKLGNVEHCGVSVSECNTLQY